MLNGVLRRIGLSEQEAEIYLVCLTLGSKTAKEIAKKTGLSLKATLSVMQGLLEKGLLAKHIQQQITYFNAVSPECLFDLISRRYQELESSRKILEDHLPQFESLMNPYSPIPKVRIYEGLKGIERVMDDTLTASEPLRTYSNIDAWFTHEDTKDYILRYAKQRVYNKKLPLRGIALDTPIARRYLEHDYPVIKSNPQISRARWLPKDSGAFSTETNIYDNKIAIACLGKNALLGIIIESSLIAQTQKSIFDAAWNSQQYNCSLRD